MPRCVLLSSWNCALTIPQGSWKISKTWPCEKVVIFLHSAFECVCWVCLGMTDRRLFLVSINLQRETCFCYLAVSSSLGNRSRMAKIWSTTKDNKESLHLQEFLHCSFDKRKNSGQQTMKHYKTLYTHFISVKHNRWQRISSWFQNLKMAQNALQNLCHHLVLLNFIT